MVHLVAPVQAEETKRSHRRANGSNSSHRNKHLAAPLAARVPVVPHFSTVQTKRMPPALSSRGIGASPMDFNSTTRSVLAKNVCVRASPFDAPLFGAKETNHIKLNDNLGVA